MTKRQFMEDLRTEIAKCSTCGQCLSVCPVFAQTGIETDGPRGRLALAQALLDRRIEPEAAVAAFASCALCGHCDGVCPAHIPLVGVFFAARRMLPLRAAHPRLFHALAHKPGVQDFLQPLLSLLRDFLAKTHIRKFPILPLQPFQLPHIPPDASKRRALFFAGCITRRFYPQIAEACVAALRSRGVAVIAPASLVCCGRPLAMQGRSTTQAVRRNLEVLASQEFQWLVTPCPGCLATLREIWPHAEGLTEGEKAQTLELAAKCVDINEFLAEDSSADCSVQSAGKVWWHRPCLMSDGANTAALELLKTSGSEIATDEGLGCCGAPLRCLKDKKEKRAQSSPNALRRLAEHREKPLAKILAARIVRKARASGASRIATGCPGCMLALANLENGESGALSVSHSVEIYMESRAVPARPK